MTKLYPAVKNLPIYKGSTFLQPVQFKRGGLPLNLTSRVVTTVLYDALGQELPLDFTVTVESAALGKIQLSLTNVQTDTLTAPGGFYVVYVQEPDTTRFAWLRGRFSLVNVASGLVFEDVTEALDGAIQLHEAALNPHPQYALNADLSAFQDELEDLVAQAELVAQDVDASEAAAALSAAGAAASAVAAASSQQAASTSQTTAAASASTATTQAGVATTQAGVATTQAGIATTQAGIATTQASLATTQASSAFSSAGSALVSETNADSSADAAALSATNAAASASSASGFANDAADSATEAADSATSVQTSLQAVNALVFLYTSTMYT